ncbi:hypothetical protein A9Y76_27230 (plasmid) [Ralstonia insidiosa]|uniref:Uncharacterized protein n=1 Tax=Ralstonia insidiosa TaxID=190721 RepID=A0A192A742_9RALS|nr:hypothetical protein A9Y76_27230 [Ralstonia insidiosa]KMW44838.1 hypothetical protein AC240_23030 [Ralstonia sp. MD27]
MNWRHSSRRKEGWPPPEVQEFHDIGDGTHRSAKLFQSGSDLCKPKYFCIEIGFFVEIPQMSIDGVMRRDGQPHAATG